MGLLKGVLNKNVNYSDISPTFCFIVSLVSLENLFLSHSSVYVLPCLPYTYAYCIVFFFCLLIWSHLAYPLILVRACLMLCLLCLPYSSGSLSASFPSFVLLQCLSWLSLPFFIFPFLVYLLCTRTVCSLFFVSGMCLPLKSATHFVVPFYVVWIPLQSSFLCCLPSPVR